MTVSNFFDNHNLNGTLKIDLIHQYLKHAIFNFIFIYERLAMAYSQRLGDAKLNIIST